MTRVVGLDLSLTSTGVATIDTTDPVPWLATITSKGRKDASLADRADRLYRLANNVIHVVVDETVPTLVVVEGPSFGQHRQTGQHDRAGLWWHIVGELRMLDLHVVEVPPATRCKYATGKGNAPKDAVLAATIRRYRTAVVTCNDEADALVLAAMGARWLGAPIEPSLPAAHLAALDRVRWTRKDAAA